MISAHKFRDSQPTTSLALFNIHEIIEPIIPGSDANALSANFPSSCDRAFNLFFIHSLAPPFLSPPLVPFIYLFIINSYYTIIKKIVVKRVNGYNVFKSTTNTMFKI